MIPTTMMSNPLVIAGIILVVLAVMTMLIVWEAQRRRRVGRAARKKIDAAWSHVLTIADPTLCVLEADKVLDLALREAGYTGTLGDKMKQAGPRFSEETAVWNAHKLRNKLAHEHGSVATEKEAATALRAFEKAIRDVC